MTVFQPLGMLSFFQITGSIGFKFTVASTNLENKLMLYLNQIIKWMRSLNQ
jgi:hypothetical protein